MSEDWQENPSSDEPKNSEAGGEGWQEDAPSSSYGGHEGDGDDGGKRYDGERGRGGRGRGGRGRGGRGGRGGGGGRYGDRGDGDGDNNEGGYRGGGRGGRGGRNYGDRGDNNGEDGENQGDESNAGYGEGRPRGRGRGRGGFRGGRRGGGDDDNNEGQEGDGEGNGEEPKGDEAPKESYRPEEVTDEQIFEERTEHYGGSGINFDAYEDIPVESSENRTTGVANSFEELGLSELVLENLKKVGYKKPTPIQKHGSPVLLNKQDLMACAQTGSGKTAAFLLPIIHHLMAEEPELGVMPCKPLALILAPTRELALQIEKEAHMYSAGTVLKCRVVYGGTVPGYQRQQLRNGCHILVATPGRLKMFINDRAIDVSEVKFFVLDEADRMLDQGFMPDVRDIVSKMPPKGERVSAMFSATFPAEIQQSAMDFLHNYVFVTIGVIGGACADVQQIFFQVEKRAKREKIMELLRDLDENDKVVIFTNSKKNTDFLAGHLSNNGVSATSIHGDRLQSQRETALKEFVQGRRKVLVATAVAARGLDIPKVSMVINYELPTDLDEYIHRIGRTGRVGNTGKAVSFYDPAFDEKLASGLVGILKKSQQEIPEFFDPNAATANGVEFVATDSRPAGQPSAVEGDEGDW